MTTEIELPLYYPPHVKECLTMGTNNFIGYIDDETVLKYPLRENDEVALATLKLEARMLQRIGPHKQIIGFKGMTSSGLLLERAAFGSIATYLKEHDPTLQQRMVWIYQATEAIQAVHEKSILHRDISASNLLLDSALNVKLSDFQGRILAPDGTILEDGLSVECTRSFKPRANTESADWMTEIFALGSVFYYILEGHEPYADLDSDDEEGQILERFKSRQYPRVKCPSMECIIHDCWSGEYTTAEGVLQDLVLVRG